MESESSKKMTVLTYRLSFGNIVAQTEKQPKMLLMEQGVRQEFSDGTNTYILLLCGIKVNRKIYQPTEIEAELDVTPSTTVTSDKKTSSTSMFNGVRNLLLQREVTLDVLELTWDSKELKRTTNLAMNCYVYEITPQLKRGDDSTKMYVKLSIFSMDKLMTLNKYSKAYVARKLGAEILKPESLQFGTVSKGVPLIESDIDSQRHLKYDDNGQRREFIQPYLVQYNESFYDFLVRTSNRCGEFLYFEDGKLVLGLPDSGDPVTITDFETVTTQEISSDPVKIGAYARDSVKDGKGLVKGDDAVGKDDKTTTVLELNQSVIAKQDTGFPKDAFPSNISSNAELAHDDYIFPLYKDKFSNLKREMFYDGSAEEIVMARLLPFSKTMLKNESSPVGALIKAVLVGEGLANIGSSSQASSVNKAKAKQYMSPLDQKTDQSNQEKAVQFGTLNAAGWTTLKYYEDILQHEEAQQRKIICIDMGTSYIPVKLGQKIMIPEFDDVYVVIQIQQNSEEAWSRDYDRYGKVADDKYAGKRSQKIYAIPAYGDKKDQFIPPVHPIPVVRKVGPQTAFVTDNEDPKFQGRVRIAFPWQSLGGMERTELDEITQSLELTKDRLTELEDKETEALSRMTRLSAFLEELKKYVKATPEERIEQLKSRRDEIEKLTQELEDSKELKTDTDSDEKKAKIEKLKEEISEFEAAAKEHDEKNGQKDYKDLKRDNTIICRYHKDYLEANKQYKAFKADADRLRKDKEKKEKKGQELAAFIEQKVKDMATPWVRVVTPMATPGGGTFFRPRVGDEVLVNFENGNVERPYVMGSMFSKNTLTPDEKMYRKEAPEMQRKDVSMSMMSPNGHHITFTDPSIGGNFLTNLISPGLGMYGKLIGFNSLIKGGKDLAGGIHIGDRYGIYEIEMKSHKRSIDINSPFGTVSINAFSGITISAPNGNVTIRGKNITLEAGNKINLLSGKNIDDPGLGDPEDKANKVGKTITGIVGGVLSSLVDQYVNDVFDLSYIRHVVEVFVRPIDGTLKLKSKRYLMLEAGKGNATIRRDRYAVDLEVMKELQEEFFKAMLTCINYINTKVDGFYDTYEALWIDGYKKQEDYRNHAEAVLEDIKKPDLVELASKAKEWDNQKITLETFEGCFKQEGLTYWYAGKVGKDLRLAKDPILKFDYVKESARAYGESAFKVYDHIKNFPKMLSADALDLGPFEWMGKCYMDALNEVDQKTSWVKDWARYFYTSQKEIFFLRDPEPDSPDNFAKKHKNIFKRKLLLSFIYFVSKHDANVNGKFFECGLDMNKVYTTESLRQEYYWNRMVFNLDRARKLQNSSFGRMLWDSIPGLIVKRALQLKSDFQSIKSHVWDDSAEGQILFSDQENSTLNFEGEGIREENSSNIGTLEHVKKTLMAIK